MRIAPKDNLKTIITNICEDCGCLENAFNTLVSTYGKKQVLTALLKLDDAEIYGTKLYTLYNNIFNRDNEAFYRHITTATNAQDLLAPFKAIEEQKQKEKQKIEEERLALVEWEKEREKNLREWEEWKKANTRTIVVNGVTYTGQNLRLVDGVVVGDDLKVSCNPKDVEEYKKIMKETNSNVEEAEEIVETTTDAAVRIMDRFFGIDR